MAQYVDGFVLVVTEKNLDAYKKMAKEASKIWRKYGALDYKECVSDELRPKDMGNMTPLFPKMTNLKRGEHVVLSSLVYKSQKHREHVSAKVHKDPYMSEENWKDKAMPFDIKRTAYGQFEVIAD